MAAGKSTPKSSPASSRSRSLRSAGRCARRGVKPGGGRGRYLLAQHRRSRTANGARRPRRSCIPSIHRSARPPRELAERIDNLAQHARTGCMLHPSYPPAQTAVAFRNAARSVPRRDALDERRRVSLPGVLRQGRRVHFHGFGHAVSGTRTRTTTTRRCWPRCRSSATSLPIRRAR